MPFVGDPKHPPAWLPAPLGRPWDDGTAAIERTIKRMRIARPRLTPGGRLGMAFDDLRIPTEDGLQLAAWWVPPAADASPLPGLAVVLHHHYGGQRATVLPWLALFHELGLPSLAIDGRGHAASDLSPPGGGSFVQRAADVRAAVAELRRRGVRRILAFGQSQGAASLVMAAPSLPDVVGVIVDSGPAPDMVSAAWGLAGNMLQTARRSGRLNRLVLAGRILPSTEPLHYQYTLWRSLAALRGRPLLWLHGDQDDVIPRDHAALWYEALRRGAPAWRRYEVAGAEHVRTLQVDPSGVRAAVEVLLADL